MNVIIEIIRLFVICILLNCFICFSVSFFTCLLGGSGGG